MRTSFQVACLLAMCGSSAQASFGGPATLIEPTREASRVDERYLAPIGRFNYGRSPIPASQLASWAKKRRRSAQGKRGKRSKR